MQLVHKAVVQPAEEEEPERLELLELRRGEEVVQFRPVGLPESVMSSREYSGDKSGLTCLG